MKSRIRPVYPETAVLLFFDEERSAAASAVLERIGLRVLVPERSEYGKTVGCLAKLSPETEGKGSTKFPDSGELIIFSGLSSKRLDTALAALRTDKLSVRFKAVVTQYNVKFTVAELLGHLIDEERKIQR